MNLSKFWGSCKKVFAWIKSNAAVLLLSFSIVAVALVVFFVERKKIKELQIELALLKTQIKLQKLATEKEIKVQQLAELKKQDKELQNRITKIETDLQNDLPAGMTEEEIASVFKELGLLKKD
jgi:Tfp pilus assembly protein PilN